MYYNHYDRYGYCTNFAVELEESEVDLWFKRIENLSENASLDFATGRVREYKTYNEALEAATEADEKTRAKYSRR